MNKNKRTLTVFRLFTFCILSIFLSCQTDDPVQKGAISEEPKEGPFRLVSMVSTEDIPRVTKFLRQKAQKDIFAKDEVAGAIFDHDNVKKAIDSLDQAIYSLRFTYPDRPENVFYNLMVGVNADGSAKEPFVIKYVCDEDQFASFQENDYNFLYFKGTISLHAFNDFFSASDFAKDCAGRNGDPAECAQTGFVGGQTPTGVSQNIRSGGVTVNRTPNGLAGYDITIRVFHTIPDQRTFEYGSGSKCHHPRGCKVDMQITGGRKHLKSTGGCADCGLPPSLGGVANLGRDFAGKINRLLNFKLTRQETSWLRSNLNETVQILSFLQTSNEEVDVAATQMTIEALRIGKLDGPYDSAYYRSLHRYVDANLTDPATIAKWASHFAAQCAILKKDNPKCTDTKVYWEASKEMVHLALDIGGMAPVVGEVCDVTNGVIYTIEGDGVNATLSFSAAIPIAGWFATGAKWAKKTVNVASDIASRQTLKWVVKGNGIIDFGQRSKLAKVLGTKGTGKHAHHIIPWAFRELSIVQKASKSKSAFHLNERLNGIPLPSISHLTGHKKYNDKVNTILTNLNTSVGNNNDLAYNEIFKLTNYLNTIIKNNPNKNLGQIADLINY